MKKERIIDASKYISNHKNSDLFDKFLSDYQEDIRKIVGKHRRNTHRLSFDDVISEANLLIIKGKNKILEGCGDEFDQTLFKKICFAYVKNSIVWSHYGLEKDKDYMNKVDLMHNSEDGSKTTFDLSIATISEEELNDFYETSIPESISEKIENIKSFFDVIIKYSYLLTDVEITVVSYLKKGFNCYEIASKTGVTHQAVSHCIRNLNDKVRSQFDIKKIGCSHTQDIINGHKALDNFVKYAARVLISNEDKKTLGQFVLSNPKKFTSRQLANILFKGRYSTRQISGYIGKSKFSKFVLKHREKA